MSFIVDKNPMRGLSPNMVWVVARFTGGGGAADMTKVYGRGVDSVKYNSATGAYKITFTNVGEYFLGGQMTALSAGSTSAQKVVNPVAYSSTDKTLTIFITDVATPTAKDLATTEELWMVFAWADTDIPVP